MQYLIGINLLRGRRQDLRVEEKNAIQALLIATIETKSYVSRIGLVASNKDDRKYVHKRDYKTESHLSNLWTEASVELRNINSDLSQRCFIKASYWTDPENWNTDQVKAARISLTSIYDEALQLLST